MELSWKSSLVVMMSVLLLTSGCKKSESSPPPPSPTPPVQQPQSPETVTEPPMNAAPAQPPESPSAPSPAPEAPVVTPPPPEPVIPAESIAQDGCLNLEKLQTTLSQLNWPSISAVTDVSFRDFLKEDQIRYFAYSNFDYKMDTISNNFPFSGFHQNQCSEVSFSTSQNRSTLYKIAKASAYTLVLKRSPVANPEFEPAIVNALNRRASVDEYTIEVHLPEREMILKTRFDVLDPLCNSDKKITLTTIRHIHWASLEERLPRSIKIENDLLRRMNESIAPDSTILPLKNPLTNSTAVEYLKTSIRPELLRCPRSTAS